MEHSLATEIEVDAYLSGSVVKALTQKSEIEADDLKTTFNNANVEIQAGSEDFRVQCQNIGKGPDGVLRMCVLDNGEVITSLKNHIDSYAVPEVINSGFEGVYEDNSETILNIASESIQGTQFLENAVAKDPYVSTIQETPVRDSSVNAAANFSPEKNSGTALSSLVNDTVTEDILKVLDLVDFNVDEKNEDVINSQDASLANSGNQFFMPDFETLLWNETNMLEPIYSEINKYGNGRDSNEYIDIDDFAFLLKDDRCDQIPVGSRSTLYSENPGNKNSENKLSDTKFEQCSNCESECHQIVNVVGKKNKNEEKTSCVSVCLNTIKQLRKVLEQRCSMAGKTIV